MLSNKKILLVGADIHNISVIKALLSNRGFTIITAFSIKEGIKHALSIQPDVILADIKAFDKRDTESFNILKNNSSSSLIVLAERGVEINELDYLLKGADDLIYYPLDEKDLLSKIEFSFSGESKQADNRVIESLSTGNTEEYFFSNLGKLVAGVIHDISSLLFSIKGNNQLAQITSDINKIRAYLKAEEKAIFAMEEFLRDLKDFYSNKKKDKEIFCPVAIIHKTLCLLEKLIKEQEVKITIKADKDLSIYGIASHYSQIALNLIVNALEAMEKGGELTIEIREENNFVITHFKDTGCGIKKSEIDKIFNYAYTSKSSGTGFGLYFTKQLIKEQNGKIEVTSKYGKGSIFSVWLPKGMRKKSNFNELVIENQSIV